MNFALGLSEMESMFLTGALTVLCTNSEKGVGNTPVIWLLLTHAGTASVLPLPHFPPVGWWWEWTWEGKWPGLLIQIDWRGIPYHRMSIQQPNLREKGRSGKFCLSFRATSTSTEILVPGKWQGVENKSFLFVCFFFDTWWYFSILFSPSPVLLRKGMIEQLEEYLASSQGQPTTSMDKFSSHLFL